MEFADFATRMYKVIGGEDQGEFARDLFLNITDFPDENLQANVVINQSASTFKDYMRGRRNIRTFAKKIAKHIEPEMFKRYIDSLEDAVIDTLVDEFSDVCTGINNFNASEMLTDIFKKIILSALEGNIKQSVPEEKKTTTLSENEVRLILETNGICQYNSCGTPLKMQVDGNIELTYELVKIDKEKGDCYDNLLMVCPRCAHVIKKHPSREMQEGLRQLKDELIRISKNSEVLSSEILEPQITAVLEKIEDAEESELVELNYDPVSIRQKIPVRYTTLFYKIRGYAVPYYHRVSEWLKEMDKDGRRHYRNLCNTMKINWLKLKAEDVSQPEAFRYMTDWMVSKTGGDRTACEVVVSYFVQNCEVFDEVTK